MARPRRNVATILQRSNASNAVDLVFWQQYLTNRFLASRTWRNLPDFYKPEVLTAWHFEYGNVAVFRRPDVTEKPITIAPARLLPNNVFGEPSEIEVTVHFGETSKQYIIPWGSYVLFHSSPCATAGIMESIPPKTLMYHFAEMATNCQRTVQNLMKWRTFPKIYAVDQRTFPEIQRLLEDADSMATAAYIYKGVNAINPQPLPEPMDLAPLPEHDDVSWQNLAQILKNWDMFCGVIPETLQNHGSRDRVTATESMGSYVGLMQLVESRQRMWDTAAKECEELFGTRIICETLVTVDEAIEALTKAAAPESNKNNAPLDANKKNEGKE